MKSYQVLMNMIPNNNVELIRDHVAIAYYYCCYHMYNKKGEAENICFVNISYDYSFSMICTYYNVYIHSFM